MVLGADWRDPSTYYTPSNWSISEPGNGKSWGEDPVSVLPTYSAAQIDSHAICCLVQFIWIDAKGRFHSLTHAGDGSEGDSPANSVAGDSPGEEPSLSVS